MPAKENNNKYYHIYNSGRDSLPLFSTDSDYDTFINYLSDYLEPPADPSTNKKMFSVQGRIYHGVPHQPKNFHGKVNLVAFSLTGNSFSLLLTENQAGSVQGFIKSLSTRYSIYYNKKYNHKGSLFDGHYKSLTIENPTLVALLTHHLHKTGRRSSFDKYLNTDVPRFGLEQKNVKTYKDFVEKYTLDETQKDLLQSVLFEHKSLHNQKTANNHDVHVKHHTSNTHQDILNPVNSSQETTNQNEQHQKVTKHLSIYQRPQELLIATALFMFLLAFGLKSVMISEKQKKIEASGLQAEVMGVSITSLDEAYQSKTKEYYAKVNTLDNTKINIYNDLEAFDINKTATTGDEYQIVAMNNQWCQIKLEDNRSGFIETKYIEIFQK